jgi:CheY-like chemotaxis protein
LSAERSSTRIVLLVEDSAGDAGLVREMLAASEGDRYHYGVVHVTRISEAVHRLGQDDVDVILLDLGLPDAVGSAALMAIQPHSGWTPIVVLTGREDEALALECIRLGAQDYLAKADIRPMSLRRSINYAIDRSQEQEIRDLRVTLDSYREISSTTMADEAFQTAPQALKARLPEAFTSWVECYAAVLRRHFDRLVVQKDRPREEMCRIVAELGQHGAGPRDLVDIHVSALDRVSENGNSVKARTLALEGRLVALEMMGLLVDYYRVRKGASIR